MTTYAPGTVRLVELRGKVRLLRYLPNDDPDRLPWVMDATYDQGDYVRSNWAGSELELKPLDLLIPEEVLRWPPKLPEPTGAGAVITADEPGDPNGEYRNRRLVRTEVPSERRWVDREGDWYSYAELSNVTKLSDGFPA